MSAGDLVCQSIQRSQVQALRSSDLDLERTKRFVITGAVLHGPLFFAGFRWLDSLKIGAGLGGAIAKMSIGQLTIFPTYLTLFSGLMGALEGKRRAAELVDKTRAFVLPTFLIGCLVWPPANIINFMFVPPAMRVAYVNVIGLFWNAILSFKNASGTAAAPAPSK